MIFQWLRKEPATHAAAAVRAATFSADPFPHLFWENVLPARLYQKLDQAWPAFETIADSPEATIARVDFTDAGFDKDTKLSTEQIGTWLQFRGLIRSTVFPLALERFKPGLCHLGRELLNPDGEKRTAASPLESPRASDFEPDREFLVIRRDRSVLAPHVDPLRFHFTLLMYFAPDQSRRSLGTTLYRQSSPGRAWFPCEYEHPMRAQYAHQQNIQTESAVNVPFAPNAALMFLNGPHSWHGQHLSETLDRKNFNANFKLRNELVPCAFRPQDAAAYEGT